MKKTITNYTINDKYNINNISNITDIIDENKQDHKYKYHILHMITIFSVGFSFGYMFASIKNNLITAC